MIRNAHLDSLEPRRLLTFAAGDAAFGSGGLTAISGFAPESGPIIQPAVVELPSGRVMTHDFHAIHYLTAKGTLDAKRGRNGKGGVFNLNGGTAVINPASGGFYWVRGGDEQGAPVQIYDANGKQKGEFRIPTDDYSAFAVTTGGQLLSAAIHYNFTNAPTSSPSVVLQFYDTNTGQAVQGFGAIGRVEQTLATGLQIANGGPDSLELDGVSIDSSGRVLVQFDSRSLHDDGSVHYLTQIARFTAAGVPDASFGTNGVATVYDTVSKTGSQTRGVAVLDRAFAADGATYTLTYTTVTSRDESIADNVFLTLYRTDSAGHTTSSLINRAQPAGPAVFTGSLALGPDGDVYIASRLDGFAAQIFRYTVASDGTMSPLDSWSDFGDARQTTIDIAPADLTVSAVNGRLLVAGSVTDATAHPYGAVYAVKDTDVFAGVPSGAIRRRADNTLLINGTTKADRVDITRTGRSIFVSINGGKSQRFADHDVAGVIIQTGKGDDRVSMADNLGISAFVDGGAGNDSIQDLPRTVRPLPLRIDTLVGGSGNDLLSADGEGSHLYGQDGNDTLWGTNFADELFGGDGNDTLHGSSQASDPKHNDSIADLLNGGHGTDLIYAGGWTSKKKTGQDSVVADASDTVIEV